jgi:hypothetical protein
MKRTITLTAEDLQFMNGMSTNRIGELFLDVHERLKGYDITPRAGDEGVWKKLDSITKPIKAPKIDPNGTYHDNPNMNAAIQEFIKHRSSIKKPMTQMGMDRLLRDFKGFTVKECISAIDTAIKGRYQGVFPKKEFSSKESPQTAEVQKGIDYSEGL